MQRCNLIGPVVNDVCDNLVMATPRACAHSTAVTSTTYQCVSLQLVEVGLTSYTCEAAASSAAVELLPVGQWEYI